MWRFIVCSFAFMGWGFYEISGGSDFEPATQSASIFAPVAVPAASAQPKTEIAEVIQPQVVLASLTTRAEPLAPLDTQPLIETQKAEQVTAPLIEEDTAEIVAAVEPPAAPVEIRKVKPNRVNVRGGPGTSYNVVAKLIKDDEVTLLSENTNGWYEIETVDGQIGWMADFLLIAAN